MIKVSVQPAFLLYALAVFCFSGFKSCIALFAALLIHEMGHYIAARIIKEPIKKVELTPFGGMITYHSGRCSSKGVKGMLLSAAGPLGNYALLLVIPHIPHLDQVFAKEIAQTNLVMLWLNMIPAFPLDGGWIVFCLCYYVFSLKATTFVLSLSGIVCGLCFAAISVFGMIKYETLNLSVLFIGLYMMYQAWTSYDRIMLENLYTVILERGEKQNGIRRVKAYILSGSERWIDLMSYINRSNREVVFLFPKDNHAFRLISETDSCRAILQHPTERIID